MRAARDAAKRRAQRGERHDRGDRGAAMVELAFVVVPLAILLFGIVWFGVLLSFKQAVTQAAAEGARAAVPYSYASQQTDAVSAATAAANGPLRSWSRPCTAAGMTCTATPEACPSGTGNCMSMTVTYDYRSHPILPNLPIISSLLPSSVGSTAVVQMNP